MNPMGLPLNWQLVKFEEVATFTKKPRDLRYSEYNEIPFVPMNLIPIATLFSQEFILKPSDKISSGTYFEPGDILLAKITPSFENGKQCIIKELPTPFGIATTEVIPIREVEGVSDKIYLFYYLLRPDVRALLAKRMQGTTGRLRLGAKTLAELEIPLPPLAEQHRIVAKLDTLSTQLNTAVDTLKAELIRAEDLRQSILKYAFSGKLVPQDPNDEPASILLEKIRDEKKQQPKQRKKAPKSKAQDRDNYPLLGLAGALEQNGDSIDAASLVKMRGGKGE